MKQGDTFVSPFISFLSSRALKAPASVCQIWQCVVLFFLFAIIPLRLSVPFFFHFPPEGGRRKEWGKIFIVAREMSLIVPNSEENVHYEKHFESYKFGLPGNYDSLPPPFNYTIKRIKTWDLIKGIETMKGSARLRFLFLLIPKKYSTEWIISKFS